MHQSENLQVWSVRRSLSLVLSFIFELSLVGNRLRSKRVSNMIPHRHGKGDAQDTQRRQSCSSRSRRNRQDTFNIAYETRSTHYELQSLSYLLKRVIIRIKIVVRLFFGSHIYLTVGISPLLPLIKFRSLLER